MPGTVRLLDPDGAIRDVPSESAAGLLGPGSGWRLPTHVDELSRLSEQATEADYGGVASTVGAAAEGFARGATLGGYDLGARLLGDEDTVYDIDQRAKAHPVAAIGGEIAGTLAPALLTAGASLPASLATRAGARIGERVAERVGEGLISKGVGAAAEGALYGAGSAVSELSLSPDPLTWEHATSALSSNMLYGGAIGGATGAAFHAAERGLLKAKGAIDTRLARPSFEAPVVSPEIAALDDAGARAAYDAEHASLSEARHAERQQFVDDLATQRAEVGTPEPVTPVPPPAAETQPFSVSRVGRPSEGRYEATFADGTKAPIGKGKLDDFLDRNLPDGWRAGEAFDARGANVVHGLPASASDIADNTVYVVRPSELAERDVWGAELKTANRDAVLKRWSEGERLQPVSSYLRSDGRLYIEDGNHRIQAAAQSDRPVVLRIRKGDGYGARADDFNISGRIRSELPTVGAPTLPDSASVSIARKQIDETNALIDKALADPEGLARNPAAIMRHLEHQESTYDRMVTSLQDEGRDATQAEAALAQIRAQQARIRQLHEPVTSQRLQELRTARQIDPSTLDRTGIKQAEEFELAAIHAEQKPEREAFVQQLRDSYQQTQQEKVWNFTKGHSDSTMRGLGAEALDADKTIRRALRNETGLAREPQRVLDALERQAQALEKINSLGNAEYAQFMRDFNRAPATIRAEMKAGKIDGYKIDPELADAALVSKGINEEMIKRFGGVNRPVLPPRLKAWEKAPAALERNRALQAKIQQLKAEPTSPYLEALRAAKEELGTPKEKSLGEAMLHAIPFAGRFAEVASIGSKAVNGLKAVSAKAARRAGEAVSSFLDVSGKATKGVAPYAPVVATKVLSALRYAPEAAVARAAPEAPKTLAGLFAARTEEIKSQTEYDQTGAPRMRQSARQALADRLRAIAAIDPILADRMETIAVRRIEFLSSIIPRRPDFGTLALGGHDLWHPSDMEMRSWARSAAAVENPHAVFERASHGAVTPEDAVAMRAVYPEDLDNFVNSVSVKMSALDRPLPFKRRLALSILSGKPIDPAMHPQVLSILQGQFTADGGAPMTSAPVAAPQFGSVKKSVPQPTPADARAQGGQQI